MILRCTKQALITFKTIVVYKHLHATDSLTAWQCGDVSGEDSAQQRHRSRCMVYGVELTNGHAGGDGVWVDDEVWHNAVLRPGHVFLGVGDTNGALLPVPTGKLVTHLWYPDGPHLASNTRTGITCLRAQSCHCYALSNKGASNV